MLRRSKRTCKSKVTVPVESNVHEPPIKRKRGHQLEGSVKDSTTEDDSSGDVFVPTANDSIKRNSKSKITVPVENNSHKPPIKPKCGNRREVSVKDSTTEDDSSGDEFAPTDNTSLKGSCTLNLSESDSDNDVQYCNKTSGKVLTQSDTESEVDDNVFQTNFDFNTLSKPQDTTELSKSDVKSKIVDTPVENGLYDNMDVAKILSVGEGVNLGTVLNNGDDTVEEEKKRDDNYTIPEMVEINVKLPNDMKCKKGQDMENILRRRMNAICKDTQVLIHKVNLLLWISYGNRLNSVLNSPEVMGSALSLVPSKKAYPPKQCDLNYLENYIKWFSKKIKLSSKTDPLCEINVLSLTDRFSRCEAKTRYELIAMFIAMLRSLGLNVRLVINLNAVSIKPSSEQLLGPLVDDGHNIMKPSCSKSDVDNKKKTSSKSEYFDKKSNKLENSKKELKTVNSKTDNRKKKLKGSKIVYENISSSDTDDNIFVEDKKSSKSKYFNKTSNKTQTDLKKLKSVNDDKKVTKKKSKISEKIDRRVLSTDEEDHAIQNSEANDKKKVKNDFWVEVFLEMEEKWFCVDVIGQRIHCIKEIYNGTTHPMRYVLAWYNDNSIKDITKRYDPYFHTLTRKIRVDPKWWKTTLRPYTPTGSAREREEDEELNKQLEEIPLPKTVSEYKNHPLYALSRHLLKFQAIYPPEPPIVGHVRNEPVYLREYVHELNGRENWLKEARVVKMGEKWYKQVKARPRFDRNGVRTDPPPLELFGYWQTEPYDPPTATNGQVPRNCYGNVDLFKPCMLPKGTVHLQLPGLLRVAKKLNIDCAPAVVGFDFHAGGSHPVNDGFVVCQEYKDTLIDAWNQELEESRKREQKRYEDRVYGNWKRLVRALLIRERLKIKYNYFGGDKEGQSTSKTTDNKK
ncbi:DNA repair protein complementing XP-C cells homolog [Myzus persicae]|uniref:DNA repair protein complementing XP-C cells homolog n=1 Tax=Myzus persicae TaxID=13164 RepID=UPI000B937C41|nr:DNA repair protein complementing XP-C cells homolog [Myzus persicae]